MIMNMVTDTQFFLMNWMIWLPVVSNKLSVIIGQPEISGLTWRLLG